MTTLFTQSLQKQAQLRAWLNSKCLEPNCDRSEEGPSVTIKIRPMNPVVGSCNISSTRNFTFESTKTSLVSCADARNKALQHLGEQMNDIKDPCPDCSYYWQLSGPFVRCNETPPGSHTYVAHATMGVIVSCVDKTGSGQHLGWIEWNACYCCVAVPVDNPPDGIPKLNI